METTCLMKTFKTGLGRLCPSGLGTTWSSVTALVDAVTALVDAEPSLALLFQLLPLKML